MITVIVQLKESSQPVVYEGVLNTYQKGDLFVIYTKDEVSYKHPIETIWRVKEEYGYHGRVSDS
jgi:hypothetical protein